MGTCVEGYTTKTAVATYRGLFIGIIMALRQFTARTAQMGINLGERLNEDKIY